MNLRGEGSMTGRNLIMVSFENNVTASGATRYADVQLHAEDPLAKGQTNLHAVTRRAKDKEGNERFSNGAPYSKDQYEAIKAAGESIVLSNGAEVTAFTGTLMPAASGSGLVVNTKKPLGASDFALDEEILDRQFASVKAARAAKAATADPQVAAEAEAQVQVQDQSEPAF